MKVLKKINYRLFLLVILMYASLSCSKEYDHDLRAKWQLRERILNEGIKQTYDSVFYNFDNNVFCFLKLLPDSYGSFQSYGEFKQKGDSLIINMKDDYYATPEILETMGWYNREMRFQIRKLNNSSLELSDRDTLYVFRKF